MAKVKIVAFAGCREAKSWMVWLEEMKIPFTYLEADELPTWHPEKAPLPNLRVGGSRVELANCDRTLFRQKLTYWMGEQRFAV